METLKHNNIVFHYETRKVRATIILDLYQNSKKLRDFFKGTVEECLTEAKEWIDVAIKIKTVGARSGEDGFELKDNFGNYITINHNNVVVLYLQERNADRVIGILDKANSNFITNRTKSKHIFRKGYSYGFNYHFLLLNENFDYVLLTDDDATYRIPKKMILAGKQYLNFKEQGFELQAFLPIETIHTFRLNEAKKDDKKDKNNDE